MNFYLDTEFNGFGGELISIALVSDDGREWYFNFGCENPCEWVKENVIPVLNCPVSTRKEAQDSLFRFLKDEELVEIIADWPEDIAHFCSLMITGPGRRVQIPSIIFRLLPISSESKIPHNALSDAHGIRSVFIK